MPNDDSKKRNIRQIRQVSPVKMLYEFIKTKRTNIRLASIMPIFHENFFCAAPTYSGVCLLTISRPMINEGENLGLTNTRMMKSVRKAITTNFIMMKLP